MIGFTLLEESCAACYGSWWVCAGVCVRTVPCRVRPFHTCHCARPGTAPNARSDGPQGAAGQTNGTSARSGSGPGGHKVAGSAAAEEEEDLVSHVFTWEHGGQNVFLTGTFTAWERHIPMHRSGHDFVTIVKLPRGQHAFKFIVDNDWRFSPEQPVVRDASGNINNYCDLGTFRHNDTEPIDYERRASNPALPYTQVAPDIDDYTRGPPKLPPHLRDIILNSPAQEEDPHMMRTPQHVTLNHLYCTAFRDGLMVQGITQRYKRKFVTTVFYSAATQFSGPQAAELPRPPARAAAGAGGGQVGADGSSGVRDREAAAGGVPPGGSLALGGSPGRGEAPAGGAAGVSSDAGTAGQGGGTRPASGYVATDSSLTSNGAVARPNVALGGGMPSVASDVAMRPG